MSPETTVTMGEPEDQKQIFFTNLLLLGFDPIAMERKYRIPFNKQMFLLPNKKGFEVVMYYLFSRLNHVQCREEFRDCWPVNDKRQEQQFRKVSHNWLVQVVKNDPEAVFPRIVASLFMSPGGDRFYELLVYFTTYILIKVSHDQHSVKRTEILHHPTLTSQTQSSGLAPVIAKAVQCGVVRLRSGFLEQLQHTVGIQEEWRKNTAIQVKRYRNHTKSVKDKERVLRSLSQNMTDKGSNTSPIVTHKRRSGFVDYDYDIQSVKRAQKVQKVRDMWKNLEEFMRNNIPGQEIVDSILEGTSEKYKIDAAELNVKVPDLLLRECEQEIQRRGVDNIYDGGKLNLLSLLHLWNLSLHLYIEKLHQAGVPSFEESGVAVNNQVLTHSAHLNNIRSLRLKLETEVLRELKDSINKLNEKLNAVTLKNRSSDSVRTTNVGLGLLPPTPPVSFEPAEGQTPKEGDRVSMTHSMKAADHVSTPEAAQELMNDVSQKVRLHQNSLVQGSPVYGPRIKTGMEQKTQTRPPSKLPVKGKVVVEKVGSKQRTRFRSAPGGQPEEPEQFAAPPESRNKPEMSGATLDSRLPKSRNPSLDGFSSHVIPTGQGASEVDSQGFKVPTAATRARKPSSRSQKTVTPIVERHVEGASHTPQADRVLVDKIADMVLGSGPVGQDESPVSNLDYFRSAAEDPATEAFQSRDKLSRTPATAQKPTWRDSLLHDSVGPLSSTRVEHSDRQPMAAVEKDQVVTKLFSSMQSDSPSNLAMVNNDSNTHLASGSGVHRQYSSDHIARIRAASPLDGPPSSISSISPRSDISSVRHHGKRQSTLLNEISLDRDSVKTITDDTDANFLMEENNPTGNRHHSASSSNNTLGSDGIDVHNLSDHHTSEQHSSGRRTPEQRPRPELLGYVSPFGKTPQQREATADSLVEEVMSRDNSVGDTSLEDLLSNLQPAQEIYQSMLDTKTPCLPTRGRKARSDAVSTVKENVLMKSFEKQTVRNSSRIESRKDNGSFVGDNTSDKESSDVEESVRVIKFQNGAFSEFLDRSPAKHSRVRFESSYLKSPEQGLTGEDPSSMQKIKEQLDSETDQLIARYKQLKETALSDSRPSEKQSKVSVSSAEESFIQQGPLTEKDVIRGGKKPKPLPLIANTPTMSFTDSYLKTSPPGGKYGDVMQSDMSQSIIVKKFCLDIDSDDESGVGPYNREVAADKPAAKGSPQSDKTPQPHYPGRSPKRPDEEEDAAQHDSPGILDLSDMEQGIESFHLGTGSPLTGATPEGFSSLLMSPYTDMIHQNMQPSGQYRQQTNTWDSLLRDASFTKIASPHKSSSVPVGNLLDL